MNDENKTGRAGAQSLDVLQVEAEEEGDAEGGGIVEEGGEIGEGKDPVVAQQDEIEQGIGGARFDIKKEGDADAPGKHHSPGPGAVLKVGGADDEEQNGNSVDHPPLPVEGFAPGIGPFVAQLGAGDEKGEDTERDAEVEDRPPAPGGHEDAAQERAAGDAGIDAGDGDAEGLAPLFRREDRHDDGNGRRHHHRATDPLQKAQGDEGFDGPGLRQQAAADREDNDAVDKDAPPAMDIAEPSHGEDKDRGREDIGRLDQSELQRRRPELAADRRQGDPDRRHHEGHEEVGDADDEEGGGAGDRG